jgi:hypothetical protein
MDVERNVIDRPNFSAGCPSKWRLTMRENFRQIADFNQRHIAMLAAPGHGFVRILTDRTLK